MTVWLPTNAIARAAVANVRVSIGVNPFFAISHASPNVPTVPPSCMPSL